MRVRVAAVRPGSWFVVLGLTAFMCVAAAAIARVSANDEPRFIATYSLQSVEPSGNETIVVLDVEVLNDSNINVLDTVLSIVDPQDPSTIYASSEPADLLRNKTHHVTKHFAVPLGTANEWLLGVDPVFLLDFHSEDGEPASAIPESRKADPLD